MTYWELGFSGKVAFIYDGLNGAVYHVGPDGASLIDGLTIDGLSKQFPDIRKISESDEPPGCLVELMAQLAESDKKQAMEGHEVYHG